MGGMFRILDVEHTGDGGFAEPDADVLIVGGGMVGMTLARACALGGLHVTVVDTLDPSAATDAGFDGRCSAIAIASQRLLEAIGVWEHLAPKAQPILEIRVSDGQAPQFLHFDHREIDDQPFGFMVENRHMRLALLKTVATDDRVTLLAPEKIVAIERHSAGVTASLAGGGEVSARLLVGADGGRSQVRGAAGIGCLRWSYGQAGIVTTVEHQKPHDGIAQERFLPSGPFAILPLVGNRSSLVWTEREDLAPRMMALDKAAFDSELAKRFGDYLGPVASVGPRWSYPLSLHNAHSYCAARLALVGDAAHGIHPIAGQGLNLGFRDVAALAEVLSDGARLGLDIGSADILARYERWRRVDVVVMAAVTDGLNRLFSNDIPVLRLARDYGLAAVDRIAPLKKFFMRHARGTVGKLPRLLTGEPL